MQKAPSQPAAPDPTATAAAQGAANRETAIAQANLNRVNEFTPYGSSVWEKRLDASGNPIMEGDIPLYNRRTTLSPDQQAILDQQTGISKQLNQLAGGQIGRVESAISQPFSYEGMPAAPEASEAARQQVIDAMYGQYTSRLNPEFEQRQAALETRLANQGIGVGSDAYSKELERFGRTRNDAMTSALNQAIASGGAEQSRLFGLGGTARANAIQEASYLRNLPLSEAAALMGTAPGVQMPQFSAAPQTAIGQTDITGPTALAYQGALNNYNQGMGQQNAALGGLFGLGGAALGGYAGSNSGSAAISRLFG